jgi:hypothetical protein
MLKKNNANRRAGPKKRLATDSKTTEVAVPHNPSLHVSTANPMALKPRRRRHRRKRVRLGDALRQRGLDEHEVADNFVGVIEKLKEKTDKSGGVEKLLVDVLKECSRHLEPARPADRLGTGDVPVHVHMVHNVTRPERRSIEN